MRPEAVIRQYASAHLGLALVADYYAAGGTRSTLRRLLGRGEWERPTRRLLRLIGAPISDQQAALAAVLDAAPDSALSHESGAALWAVPGFDLLPAHVTQRQQPAHKKRLELGLTHYAAWFPPEFRTELEGIPVVTPSFLALQLFGTVHPLRARRAVSKMLMLRLVSERSLTHVLDAVAVQGRNGVVLLREFIENDASHSKSADSGLELRYEEILVRDGQRPMRRQVNLGGREWLGRIDEVDDELPFIVQIDSALHHGALIDQEADDRQREALEDAGFTVRRFTDDDCFFRPAYVASTVRETRAQLRRRLAG